MAKIKIAGTERDDIYTISYTTPTPSWARTWSSRC